MDGKGNGWLLLLESSSGAEVFEATADPASLWFDGHFPGEPIFPGAGLLAQVQELAWRQGFPQGLASLRRVKFRRLVRPGERLALKVWPLPEAPSTATAFEVKVGDDLAASGVFGFDAALRPLEGPAMPAKPDLMPWELDELLPHRGSMRFLNAFRRADLDSADVGAVVTADWPLVRDGAAACVTLVEAAAQAVAVWAGWKDRVEGKAVRKGFLVGVKQAAFHASALKVGTSLEIELRAAVDRRNFGMGSGRVLAGTSLVAEVVLQFASSDVQVF